MKKVKAFSIDEETYKKFKIYSIKAGKSVSQLIEEFMKKKVEKER